MNEPTSPIPSAAPPDNETPSGDLPPAAPDPDILKEWDPILSALWSPMLSTALEAAGRLYANTGGSEPWEPWPEIKERLAGDFWRTLTTRSAQMPETPAGRYQAVVAAVWRVLRQARTAPDLSELPALLATALRPVRTLRAGILTAEVCAALYHRGLWTPYLTKPQMYVIRTALAATLAALPPDEMGTFWENLRSENPMVREAMALGLEFLRSAHAVPHLLHGLETSRDHAVRSAIVDCLEEIADPRAIAPLMRLHWETAQDDWTLSRHIGRVIRVIEQQNRNQSHRTLLRPTQTPTDLDTTLLRPAANAKKEDFETDLLHPAERSEPTDHDA